jgi:hypothetical protein
MKKIVLSLIAIVFASGMSAQNGAYIEFKMSSTKGATGTVKAKHSEFGSLSEMTMVIPQMPGGGMNTKALIQKSNPDVTYIINDKDKTYSERKKSDASKEDNKTYEVKKIGEETVNGYKCVHAIITEGKETHEVWNTKDIADYDKYAEAMKTNERMSNSKREKALKDAGCEGFPVKTFHKGNEREGDFTMELVKLEKKTFSKSDFELPAGYTKSDAAQSPGQPAGMKTQQEIMNMTPEERAKYIEEMKKQYGGDQKKPK